MFQQKIVAPREKLTHVRQVRPPRGPHDHNVNVPYLSPDSDCSPQYNYSILYFSGGLNTSEAGRLPRPSGGGGVFIYKICFFSLAPGREVTAPPPPIRP